MAQKTVVRLVRPSEIESVIRLCEEHAAYEKAEFSAKGIAERLHSAIFSDVPRLWCFVAEIGEEIIGYATCTRDFSTWRAADYLHLDCLYITQEHRKAGIGAEVMQAIMEHADRLGCAVLEWQTPSWNKRAARFYERLGARSSYKLRFCWGPNRDAR